MVSLVSFGYKLRIPADADLVFDVRFLPNPHFIPKSAEIFGQGCARAARTSARFRKPGEFLRRSRGC